MAHRKKSKRSKSKTILRLPDLEQSKNAALHSLAAASSQESYGHAIDEFIGWYCSVRIGNWLTVDQSRTLLDKRSSDGLPGKRDRAILALLIGCGLRRAELVGLGTEDFQIREERWVIANLVGKGKHIRTVPVPGWVKGAVDEWITAAGINDGAIFRRISRLGKIWGDKITAKAIWHVVKAAAKRAGIKTLAPHDLRRTCARLCHLAGGELEQIQFLLGHASVETTERYLGCKQKLSEAVNDNLGLEDP